ncbi:MAG: hypothetical protein M0Z45_11245 [Actinomycetota bacterium]|nr:hypothetical protein [Actinomycetota bacterium]MDA8278743.1 hypothetical protein [Actinomycetota bacterium]
MKEVRHGYIVMAGCRFGQASHSRLSRVVLFLAVAFGVSGILSSCAAMGGSTASLKRSEVVSGSGQSSLNIGSLIAGSKYLNIKGSCSSGGQIKIYTVPQNRVLSYFALGNCVKTANLPNSATWSYSIAIAKLASAKVEWFASKISDWRLDISGSDSPLGKSRFLRLAQSKTVTDTTVLVPSSAPACTAAQLTVGIVSTTVTAGDQLAYLDVANISQSSCSLVGAPIIAGLSANGATTKFTSTTPQIDVSMLIRFKNQNSFPDSASRVVLENGIESADSIIDSDANCAYNQPNATVTYTKLSISLPGVSGNFTLPTTAFHDGNINLGIQSCPNGSPSFSSVQVPPRYSFLLPSQSLIP